MVYEIIIPKSVVKEIKKAAKTSSAKNTRCPKGYC